MSQSGNPSLYDLLERITLGRRRFLKTTLASATMTALGDWITDGTASAAPTSNCCDLGFESIPPDTLPLDDRVRVPAGYQADLLIAWGDPVLPGAPTWREDASQDAAAQARQFGMHNDGMHFFPLPDSSSEHGLLCVNHEFTHEEILHGNEGLDGGTGVTLAKVRKSQAAHGVSIIEIRRHEGQWRVVRDSRYGRRITANTPMRVSGPAAGHALLKSKRFEIKPAASSEAGTQDGYSATGTMNNCASGVTPWGTFLTCEENWNNNFGWLPDQSVAAGHPHRDAILNGQTRYGIKQTSGGYRWHEVDPRLNAATNPLEPHLYGWVVEIDPLAPGSMPVKRTALGRFKHENAQFAISRDGRGNTRLAFYMGDDERNEYLYKFVCTDPLRTNDTAASRDLLDRGILYAAQFTDTAVSGTKTTYRGRWIALLPDTESVIPNPAKPGSQFKLRELPQFRAATDAEVIALILIKTRQAADAVGATMMDRPEWVAVRNYANRSAGEYDETHPLEIYCTLTNNDRRGGGGDQAGTSVNAPDGTTAAGTARPPVDAANPRPDNVFGHIIRWREDGQSVAATGFEWDIFVLAGDRNTKKQLGPAYSAENRVAGVKGRGAFYHGNIIDKSLANNVSLAAPDGLWFDHHGRLWILTDNKGDGKGDWIGVGANALYCADPYSKEIRRFLTGPTLCEITGITGTPDGKTLFVGIQHPGDDAPTDHPTKFSNWPQGQFATNSAGEPLPNGPKRRPRSGVIIITRDDGGVIGAPRTTGPARTMERTTRRAKAREGNR